MAYTVQQLLDRARLPLNDPDKVRLTDTELLTYANDAFLRIRKKRPDLFLGMWNILPAELAVTAYFPVSDEYMPIIADYITARAEMKDDEHIGDGRAAGFVKLFEDGLVTP